MKKTGWILACLCILSTTCRQVDQEPLQIRVAGLYATAWSFPERLPSYIQDNKKILESRRFQKLLEEFIQRLEEQDLNLPSTQKVYQRAVRITSQAGRPAMAQQLFDSMMGEKLRMQTLAQHYRQLSGIIDADDDPQHHPFKQTEIYAFSSVFWNMMHYTTSEGFVKSYQQMLYDLNIWYIRELMNQMES